MLIYKISGHLKDGVLRLYDDMCGKNGRSKGDAWRQIEELKEAISRKKDAHKTV